MVSLRVFFSHLFVVDFFGKILFTLIRYDANYNKRWGVGVEASEQTPTPTLTPDSWLVSRCHDSGDTGDFSPQNTLFFIIWKVEN